MAESRWYARVNWDDREPELCEHLADGLSFEEIAVRMQVSVNVVKIRFYTIKRKFGWQGE